MKNTIFAILVLLCGIAVGSSVLNFAAGSGGGGNTGTCTSQTLTAPTITGPVTRTIIQRTALNVGTMTLSGTYTGTYTSIQAQAVPVSGYGGTPVPWTTIVSGNQGSPFTGNLTMSPGWYNVYLRVFNGASCSAASTALTPVGVGEVIIATGQSLMGGGGQFPNSVDDDRVNAVNFSGVWSLANDPQPIPGGSGSPIPIIGDDLVSYLNMPIGFIDVAVGNTTCAQWQSTYYTSNLLPAIHLFPSQGFRAIIWEQGQAEASNLTTQPAYTACLEALIAQSRSDAGWNVPWGIARSTYTGSIYVPVNTAQGVVASTYPFCFQGSNTDSINDPTCTTYRAADCIHLRTAGQVDFQGPWWAASLETYFGW